MKALSDIVVIDMTRLLPGPLAGSQLSGLGAKVIKIEHPTRPDAASQMLPFVDGESVLYRMLNGGKEIKKIGWDSPEGKEELFELIKTADVFLEQFKPGLLKTWGLDYETLSAKYPQIIYVSITGYGQEGLYSQKAGHDLNYLALSGALQLNRETDAPVIPGFQMADVAGGSYQAVTAVLAGLLNRQKSGKGCWLDVSMLEGVLPVSTIAYSLQAGGMNPDKIKFLWGDLVNYNIYRCRDGRFMALGALELKFWNAFCEAVGRADWKREHLSELSKNTFLQTEVTELFLTRTRKEWTDWAEDFNFCLTPIKTPEEALQDEHFVSRNAFVKDDKDRFQGWNLPFRMLRE